VEGHSPLLLLDNPLVASEAVKTLIGSFALVLTAPLTALISGIIYTPPLPQNSAENIKKGDIS
jgi:uncharacterized membrane protein